MGLQKTRYEQIAEKIERCLLAAKRCSEDMACIWEKKAEELKDIMNNLTLEEAGEYC